MKRAATWCIIALLLTACATLGIGKPDTATRILANLACLTALTAAGVQVAGDPALEGAKTAMGVLTAIMAVGTSSLPGTVMAACADTLSYVAEDATGALALVKGTAEAPPAQRAALRMKAAQVVPKAAPPVPTRVVIPLK